MKFPSGFMRGDPDVVLALPCAGTVGLSNFKSLYFLNRGLLPSEGQRLVSGTRSSGSTRYLLGESLERKFLFLR